MGRETKILLGFLGLLAGAFFGVLSAKLFVPRPPAGAGPDINTDVAAAESHALVEPPVPSPRAWDFAAAPPLAPAAPAPPAAAAPSAAADTPLERPRAVVTRVAWEAPAATRPAFTAQPVASPDLEPLAIASPAIASPDRRIAEPAPVAAPAFHREPGAGPATTVPPAASPTPVAGAPTGYVVRAGDSWWALAAAAYGDGRFYRALFAWNRAVDPRIALAPGTRLEIPPRPRLEAAWPRLLPAAGSTNR